MDITKDGLRPSTIAVGLAAFAALAALGALTAGWLGGGNLTPVGIGRSLSPGLVGSVLGLVALDYGLGGLRLHLWVRHLAPGTPYTVSLKAHLVTLFAGPLSPMSAASGPTQIATLARCGISPARALAGLLLNYIGILTALLTVGGLGGLYLLHRTTFASAFGGLERSLLAGAVAIPLLVLVLLSSPRPGQRFAAALRRAARLPGRTGAALAAAGRKLEGGVAAYGTALAALRSEWKAFLGSFSISAFMLLERGAIAFLVARALGFEGGYVPVAAPHAVQHLLLYFSPTPGGSGLAEASVPILLGGVVPAGASAEFALLWRAATSYLGIGVGAIALALVFGPAGRRGKSQPATIVRRLPPPATPGETASG